ncbi:MAG: hypothetical protein AAF827_07080 [Cyanobacteria bacterium P01_D01_bin.6]
MPAALAANDTKLYALLEKLENCDRHVAAKPTATKTSMVRRQLLQIFTRHPAKKKDLNPFASGHMGG